MNINGVTAGIEQGGIRGMCGRFSLRVEMEELLAHFGLVKKPDSGFHWTPRYNIAPGQMIAAVIDAGGERRIGPLRWGLVPGWAKDEKIGSRMINARSETLHEKPAFRGPLVSKRCLIPADGYYEWHGSDKQPFRITLKNRGLFSMAGLYETRVREDGSKLHTCTIVTTEANALTRGIHERMPVILDETSASVWLDRTVTDAARLLALLGPYPSESMDVYPVSPIVGNVKNDVPACIEPFDPAERDRSAKAGEPAGSPVQQELF